MQYNNIKTILRNAVTTGDDTDYLLFYYFYKYMPDVDVMYFIAENELVYGKNVLIISDCITSEFWIREINFNRNFNSGLDPKSTDIKILKADDILYDTYEKPWYKELEIASWFNFRHREDYGRLRVDHKVQLLNCDKSIIDLIDECLAKYGADYIDYIFVDLPITDDDINAIDKYIGEKSQIKCMVNIAKLKSQEIQN